MNFHSPHDDESSIGELDPFYQREKEKYGTPIPSREYILEQLKAVNLPLKLLEVANLFSLSEVQEQTALKHRLLAMVRDGQLERNHRQQFFCVKELPILTGTIVAHREGFGFLKVESVEKPFFVSPKQMRMVLHGDLVAAHSLGKAGGHTEVRILKVLVPRDPKFVGICKAVQGSWVLSPYIPFLLPSFTPDSAHSTLELEGLKDQLVVAEITERASKKGGAKAKILKALGSAHVEGIEKALAIEGYALPTHWSSAVLKEVEALLTHSESAALASDSGDRVDLTHLPFVTIDGEDSKDFDDAVFCHSSSSGWTLFVAIADVEHFVPMGSAIDLEARKRGTSVYFPREVIPMLPAVLSENLCSLLPHQSRLTVVCEMTISHAGECESFKFYPARILSQARLTYGEVAQALERAPDHPLMKRYPSLVDLLALLKVRIQHRERRGALDLNLEANTLLFSESGEISAIVAQKRDLAHCLIEEAMILANSAAAKQIADWRIPGFFRTHSPPVYSRLERLRPIWKSAGAAFPSKIVSRSTLGEILKSAQTGPHAESLQLLVLRTLQPASYETRNLGHFGLALKSYTHFTSPIRRYPDLIVHRILKQAWRLSQAPTPQKKARLLYSKKELQILAEHCNLTERRADYASRDVLEWLKTRLAQKHMGEKLPGIISGFNAQYVFVKLTELLVEGSIAINTLIESRKKLNLEKQMILSDLGRLMLGTKIEAEILSAEPSERFIALKLIQVVE